jgi:hypothetical protein
MFNTVGASHFIFVLYFKVLKSELKQDAVTCITFQSLFFSCSLWIRSSNGSTECIKLCFRMFYLKSAIVQKLPNLLRRNEKQFNRLLLFRRSSVLSRNAG